MKTAPLAALTGVLLVFAYTALISSADAITKLLSDGYAAPQLFAVSGGLVALFSWIMSRIGKARADQAAKTAASLPAGDALRSQPSPPTSPRGASYA